MNDRHTLFRTCLIAGALALAGCGERDEDPVADYCQGRCEWASECNSNVSLSGCIDSCNAHAPLRAIRDDVLEGWLACAEELGCYASDDDLRRCDEASAISVEPSRLAFEFCTRLAALELQCGYWTDRSRCAETVKGWNDATFEAAMRCTEEAVVGCEGTWDCFDDVVRGER